MRLGIDLGGTKIQASVFDAAGRELFLQRLATPQGDYLATLEAIKSLIDQAEKQLQQSCSIGIATPGSPSPQTGRMKNCNSTCLNNRYLQKDIESLLARPVRMANDANCFTHSEALDGVAANAKVVFGVILGTGVGGGLSIDKKLLSGVNGIAGEWGHNPLPRQFIPEVLADRGCYCGRQNCIETYLAGSGLTKTYQQLYGIELSAYAIVAAAESGQEKAMAVMAIYRRLLALALSNVINILDPDMIVLGGGMSKTASLYQEVPRLWSDFVFNDEVATQLAAPQYGDASGVRAAAWLWG